LGWVNRTKRRIGEDCIAHTHVYMLAKATPLTSHGEIIPPIHYLLANGLPGFIGRAWELPIHFKSLPIYGR